AEGDARVFTIYAQDIDFDFLPAPQHIARMSDTAPTEFADMNEAFQPAEVNKCAEVTQVCDRTFHAISRMQACQNLCALTCFDPCRAFRKNKTILIRIKFNYP